MQAYTTEELRKQNILSFFFIGSKWEVGVTAARIMELMTPLISPASSVGPFFLFFISLMVFLYISEAIP